MRNKKALYIQKQIIVSPSEVHPPFRLLIKGSLQSSATEEENFFVANEQKQYTPEFIGLLRDYYLHLG